MKNIQGGGGSNNNNNLSSGNGNGNGNGGKNGKNRFKPWRFENPDNEATRVINGRTWRWCSNDCHPQTMWCGKENCLNKADFAKKMEKEKSGSDNSSKNTTNSSISKDFKIALAAMTSAEDFALLKSQFFPGK